MSFFNVYKISIGHILRNRIVGSKICAFKILVDVAELPMVSIIFLGFPDGSAVKHLPAMHETQDMCSVPGLGRFPGEGIGNPLQYYYLENPTDERA